MYNDMKIETLVLAFFLHTLPFSDQIRRGYCVITVKHVT